MNVIIEFENVDKPTDLFSALANAAVVDDGGESETQVINGVPVMGGLRRRIMSVEEKGFFNLMREGFQCDDCDLTLLQKVRALQIFKKRPEVRGDMIDAFSTSVEFMPPADVTAIGMLVGCDDCEPEDLTPNKILVAAASESGRDWDGFGEAMKKILEVIATILKDILPMFF